MIRGYACDYTEKGKIMICAQSVEKLEGVEIPEKPKGIMSGRLDCKKFRCLIQADSNTSGKVIFASILDAGIAFPEWMNVFILKNIIGLIMWGLRSAAKKITNDPYKNAHAVQIRKDPYYLNHMIPRIDWWCQRAKWPHPKLEALEVLHGNGIFRGLINAAHEVYNDVGQVVAAAADGLGLHSYGHGSPLVWSDEGEIVSSRSSKYLMVRAFDLTGTMGLVLMGLLAMRYLSVVSQKVSESFVMEIAFAALALQTLEHTLSRFHRRRSDHQSPRARTVSEVRTSL